MTHLYHETSQNALQQILNQGLLAEISNNLLEPFEIQEDNDGYYLLPDGHDAHYYGEKLAHTILEHERPQHYPKHHHCIFFFPTTELLGDLNRQAAVSIHKNAFTDKQLYQTPYQTANKLFHQTMKTLEIANHIDKTALHETATKYWTQTQQVTINEIQPNTEVFTDATHIPATHITQYEN